MKVRHYLSKEWLRAHVPLLAVVVAFAVIGVVTTWLTHADSSNVTVNFNSTTAVLPPGAIGVDVSTYDASGSSNITSDATQAAALKTLGIGFAKVPIQWANGAPVSAANGGDTKVSAEAWISSIKQTGAIPEIVIGGGADDKTSSNSSISTDDNFTATDAANLVKYFNTPGTSTYNPVTYWAIGNEPDGGGLSVSQYCTLFNAAATAMKAVDPTIKIDGPTFSFYSESSMQQFLTCAGSNLDIVDFHAYGTGNQPVLDNATLLSQTSTDEQYIKQIRQMINTTDPSRASQMQIQVGEYNLSYTYNDNYGSSWTASGKESRFFDPVETVWGASTLGGILEAGGRGMQYGDRNGALGTTFDGSFNSVVGAHYGTTVKTDDPMPIYHAQGMFTGESLFRGFGTNVVSSSTTLPNVDVFASSNDDDIVLVNKNPSTAESATIDLTGFAGGSADVWQTSNSNPLAAPTKVSTIANVTSSLTVNLPAYTVTTIVLNGGSTTTTTSAPTISSVASGTPSTSGATVTWATDQSSTSQVQYGTTASYGSTTTEDSSMVTSHSVALSGLAAGTTYHYRVISTNSNNQTTSSSDYTFTTATATSTPTPPPPTATTLSVPFRINVGGSTYKDASGNTWLADTDFTGGTTDDQGAGKTISGTSAQAIYQDERYGTSFSYALPVANGTYKLQLDFAEIYPGCSKAGCRVFNVAVNGSTWLSKLDIAAKVGTYTALTESENVTVTSGKIAVALTGVTGSAQLAGIEVTAASTTTTPPSVSSSVTGAIVGIGSKCLDNKLSNFQNGNAIQLYACNQTAAQTWTIPGDGTIRLDGNKFCLDVQNAGTVPGTPVQLYSCNGTAAQQWVVNSNGSISNPHSGLCLDDEHSGTSNGNPIWVYTCNGTNAQKWTVPKS